MKKLAALAILPIAAAAMPTQAAEEVNIYSFRQAFLIKPMLEAFTAETGIKTNVVFAKKGLVERLKNEGKNSKADLLLTADTGNLIHAVNQGLAQPVQSEVLDANIPEQYRDPNDNWYALTARSRIVYASKDRVKPGELKSYEDLADPKWKGRICTRSGKHSYNLSLFGSMIAHHGEAEAEKWLAGVKDNLARKPQGNDRAQVKAVYEGVCDLAIGNTYYFGKMLHNKKNPEQVDWANSVNLVFPNQDDRGAHMNITGAAVTKYAPNRDNAIKLMEFLSSTQGQEMYAQVNYEFPVKPGTPLSGLVKEHMSDFKADKLSLSTVAENRTKAAKLVDKVQYDH
ncbi:iron ABC transporter substrate-binding protein [Motiliproteus coralliicola]|uniref:Iron ABC transporter substrate-binding protein n=1 Tax=Motiliproteus coralliicola TaxID=2283196 RepID=A0A369WNL8_9GAMM|nr:Fe(3+) ABC transporter substrate-binding protein [Motiliproteus coralliicola]RDE22813.1 iron ABC transporter substrate-binding protein [Motiliproteus coralliicola]